MIRRRRAPIESGSSDDGSHQPRKYLRTTMGNWMERPAQGVSNVQPRSSQARRNTSSESSYTIHRRRQSGRLPVSTSDESLSSGSSENEIFYTGRRGSMRALSDYETGDSSDRASGSAVSSRPIVVQTDEHTFNTILENSIQTDESSASSSEDSSPVRFSGRRKRQSNPMSTSDSDSSDSGMPIGFGRQRKRMKIRSSSEDCDSDNSAESEHNTSFSSNNTATYYNRPLTRSLAQATNNQLRAHGSGQTSQLLNNAEREIEEEFPVDTSSDDSDSSVSDIRPRIIQQHNIIFSDNSSSSSSFSDSDDSLSVRRAVRRGAQTALRDSDEDKPVPAKKPPQPNSSDSDGESEKCPICLARFNSQEVGTPECCEHCFCLKCILEWSKNNNTCPVDRQLFNSISVRFHFEGKVVRKVPIETPVKPDENDRWWEIIGIALESEGEEGEDSSDYEYMSFEEGPDEVCNLCNSRSRPDFMIVCDDCQCVYHMDCLNPPLQSVPVTEWYCPRCNGFYD